jgi:hypothetical protein
MVSDIPAGDGNIEKLFYGVYRVNTVGQQSYRGGGGRLAHCTSK